MSLVFGWLKPFVRLLKWMISQGYSDPRTLARRVKKMEAWLQSPSLMEADKEAEYAAVIDIKLDDLKAKAFEANYSYI